MLLDNEQLYKICENRLGLKNPNYADANAVVADHFTGITAAMRFGGYLKKDFQSVVTHLSPIPKLHFVTPSKAPHVSTN